MLLSQWNHWLVALWSQQKLYFWSLNSYTCARLQRLRPHAAIFSSPHALRLCNALEASQASFESTPVSGMRWQSSTRAYFCSENWAGYNKEREGKHTAEPCDPEGRNSRCNVFDISGVAAAQLILAGYIIQSCLFLFYISFFFVAFWYFFWNITTTDTLSNLLRRGVLFWKLLNWHTCFLKL